MFRLDLAPLFWLAVFGLACVAVGLLAGVAWLFMLVLRMAGAM